MIESSSDWGQIAFVIQNKHGCHAAQRTGSCQEAVTLGQTGDILLHKCAGAAPVEL